MDFAVPMLSNVFFRCVRFIAESTYIRMRLACGLPSSPRFYCCSLPIRVYILGIHRILWPMLYGGLAKKYEVAKPYNQILMPDADLTQVSTHTLVTRVVWLQSLKACDRECFLDLSCAFAALALQAGQRKQEGDMYRYLSQVQAMLQVSFLRDPAGLHAHASSSRASAYNRWLLALDS